MARIDCVGKLLAQARQMSACDVASFVRKHADDLVRCLRFEQCAAVDEDATAVGDESVERTIVDDDGLHVLLGESRRAQQRLGIISEQLFDFGIADDRRTLLRMRGNIGRHQRGGCDERDYRRRWCRPPRAARSLVYGHVRSASHQFAAQPSGAPEHGQRGDGHVWLRIDCSADCARKCGDSGAGSPASSKG